MRFIFVAMILLILSCEDSNGEQGYEIPHLKENILAFIKGKKCPEKSIDIMVVSLEVKNDTLTLDISNTYPNIKVRKFNCDTVLFGRRIIFTGDRIKGYGQNATHNQFPADITEINKNQEWLLIEEYALWTYRYKNGKLIYKYTSCAETK